MCRDRYLWLGGSPSKVEEHRNFSGVWRVCIENKRRNSKWASKISFPKIDDLLSFQNVSKDQASIICLFIFQYNMWIIVLKEQALKHCCTVSTSCKARSMDHEQFSCKNLFEHDLPLVIYNDWSLITISISKMYSNILKEVKVGWPSGNTEFQHPV